MNEIIVALISLAGIIITSIISNSLIKWRLSALEEKVDKHNNLIDRTYKLEERTELQEEKIKVANHRIDDLEKEAHA